MSSIDYISLYILLFGSYYIWAKYIKYNRLNANIFTIVSILIFAFVEGCRYDRGTDYLWYKFRYNYPLDHEEPMFLVLNNCLHFIGLNYVGAFIVYAAIFMVGVHFLVKSIDEEKLKYAYLFVLCSCLVRYETLVREFIAIPILFISCSFLFEKKYLLSVLFLLLAFFTHKGIVFLCVCLLFFYLLIKQKLIPFQISIIALSVVYIADFSSYSQYVVHFINKYVTTEMVGDRFSGYVTNAERWFLSASILKGSEQSPAAKMLQFGFEVGMIYVGYFVLKKEPNAIINIFYHTFIVGAIILRCFWGFEILTRIGDMLYLVWFIPAAYIVSHYKLKTNSYSDIAFFSMIIYLLLYWGRNIFFTENCKFIWSI